MVVCVHPSSTLSLWRRISPPPKVQTARLELAQFIAHNLTFLLRHPLSSSFRLILIITFIFGRHLPSIIRHAFAFSLLQAYPRGFYSGSPPPLPTMAEFYRHFYMTPNQLNTSSSCRSLLVSGITFICVFISCLVLTLLRFSFDAYEFFVTT